MKKFLKIFLVIIIVIGAAGLTAFLFFKNYKKEEDVSASLLGYLQSEEKVKFNSTLSQLNLSLKSELKDTRFDVIEETITNLDEILEVITPYFISEEAKVNNDRIITQMNSVDALRSLSNSMMIEYNKKSESSFFDPKAGANDMYKTMANYIVSYANLMKLLNLEIDTFDLNKQADLKFAMIEVYSNVAISAFSKTGTVGGFAQLEDSADIEEINKYFELKNSYVNLPTNKEFDTDMIRFILTYGECDKTKFAKEFAENLANVPVGATQDQITSFTKEQVATYWFKIIYGVSV